MYGAAERYFARLNAARSLRREYHFGLATRIAAMTAGFLTADFFAPAMLEGTPPDTFSSALLGILPAQVGLLAIWGALGPGRWRARLLLTTALAALGWFAFAVGFNTFADVSSLTKSQFFRVTACVPLLFLTAQTPLWVARWTRGWRLSNVSTSVAADDREARRFSMIDLLLAPLAIAAPLALARWQLLHFDNELKGLLAIVFPFTAVSIGFSTLVTTQTAFRCRTLPRGFLAVAGYSLGLSAATNAGLLAAFGMTPDFSPHRFLSVAIISTFFFMFPSLLVLRRGEVVLLPEPAKRARG